MKIIAILAAMMLLATGGMAAVWYRNQVSDDFKRTLIALVDPSSTKNDVHAYLRDARLRVHTRRDNMLLQKAEQAVVLDKEADRLSESNLASLMAETKNPYQFSGPFYSEVKLAGASGNKVSPAELERLNSIKATSREARAKNSALLDDSIAAQKSDADGSLKLLDELRDALGAPGKGQHLANQAPTYDVLSGIKKQNDGIQKITEDYMDRVESDMVHGDQLAKARAPNQESEGHQ